MKFFHRASIKTSLLSLAYLLCASRADAGSIRDRYHSIQAPLLIHSLPSEQKDPALANLAQLQIPIPQDSIRQQIRTIRLDSRLIDILRRSGSGLNQPQFVATRITPDTSELDPAILSRKDKENPRELEQKVFQVFFGPTGGRAPTDPSGQIDCSRLAIKSTRETDLQTVFRIESRRNVTGGAARTQLMYGEEGITQTNPNNRGTLRCDEETNSLLFRIPGRLLGGSDVTLHAIAYSKTGLVAYREFKYKVENPDIIVRLNKVRNNSRKRNWDVRNPFKPSVGRPDIYVAAQAILNTGRSAIDSERGSVVSGPPQLGVWGNVPPGEERRPGNTTIYNGQVGLGVELGIVAYDHDDYNLALINAQLWQAGSAIYCQIEQYCPDTVPQATAPLHRLMQNAIRRAGNDDFMAGTEIRLRPDSDRAASSLVGRNWGLDPTPALVPSVDGYEINMGNVSVWLTFMEADPSWFSPDDLI